MFPRILFMIMLSISFSACNKKAGWAETEAIIIVEPKDRDAYGYIIQYDIPESTAINKEGKKITGPIQQYSLSKQKPVNGQRLKMKYMIKEPIIFKFLDSMRFESLT